MSEEEKKKPHPNGKAKTAWKAEQGLAASTKTTAAQTPIGSLKDLWLVDPKLYKYLKGTKWLMLYLPEIAFGPSKKKEPRG